MKLRAGDFALPLFVGMVYLNLSSILVRYHELPSLLSILVAILALIAFIERGAFTNVVMQPLTFFMAAYLVLLLVTSTFARSSELADERLLDLTKAFGIALLVMATATARNRLRNAALVLIGSAAFLALLGIFQTVTGTYERWYAGFARVKNAHIYGDVFQPRIAGPLGDPNFFAQILLIAVPIALFLGWETERRAMRLFAFSSATVIIGAILLTYSRGGMLALAIVIALALLAHRVNRRGVFAAAAAFLVLLFFLPPSFTRRFITIEQLVPGGEEELHPDASFEKRKLLTAAAWETFKGNPLLGVGAGNYTVWFDEYAERVGSAAREYDDPGERHYPHNLYLEIAAESGIAGLLAFSAIVIVSFANIRSARRELLGSGDLELAGVANALQLALIGYLISSLFLHGHFQRYLWMVFALGAALADFAARKSIARHSTLVTQE